MTPLGFEKTIGDEIRDICLQVQKLRDDFNIKVEKGVDEKKFSDIWR